MTALALAKLFTCGLAAAATGAPGLGGRQTTERAATGQRVFADSFCVFVFRRGLQRPVAFVAGGGLPLLFHRETRRGGRRRRANAAPLRPLGGTASASVSLRKNRISTRPGPPALSSSGSSPAPRKPRRNYANRSCWLCASVFAWTASKLHLCAPH
jgi:hypothetical protein